MMRNRSRRLVMFTKKKVSGNKRGLAMQKSSVWHFNIPFNISVINMPLELQQSPVVLYSFIDYITECLQFTSP